MNTRLLLFIFTLPFASFLISEEVQPEEPLDVFVMVGTSNMAGVAAPVKKLSEEQRKPHPNILVFQNNKWLPLQAAIAPYKKKEIFGPEVTFGPMMSEYLGKPIGIIQSTLTAVKDNKGYRKTLATVKKAQASRPIQIKGMVVQAGERDGGTEAWAQAFEQNLISLIESARKDFNAPSMPLVINLAIPNPEIAPYVMDIRDAQSTFTYPGFQVVDCDSIPQANDKIHYTVAGELEFGRRLANVMIELLELQKSPKP
ncbi:sialate O-acetylesterase [Kiritimatiellota bacterium B12222]|nr:sialate O-acetylesterase [Kiritimatiellota bacterium B12222]